MHIRILKNLKRLSSHLKFQNLKFSPFHYFFNLSYLLFLSLSPDFFLSLHFLLSFSLDFYSIFFFFFFFLVFVIVSPPLTRSFFLSHFSLFIFIFIFTYFFSLCLRIRKEIFDFLKIIERNPTKIKQL